MIASLPLMSLILVVGLAGLGWWLAQVNSLARKLGSTMVILMLGLLLANVTTWTPDPSAVSWVNGPLTSFAIAELLLAVELRSVIPDARRLLLPFLTAVAGTLVAVVLVGLLLSGWLGQSWMSLAGLLSATFTGGSLNFVSVARSLEIPPSLLLIATAADHVAFTAWFVVSLLIGRGGRQHRATDTPVLKSSASTPTNAFVMPSLREVLFGLLWGGAVLLISDRMGGFLRLLGIDVPSILVLTTVALIAAQLPRSDSRSACYGLGLVLIQPFFAVIGLSSSLGDLFGDGLPVLLYAGLVVLVQAIVVLQARRWFRWPLAECLVASQAAVGGPSTALALAGSLERPNLVLPSVAIGLLGYLLGTYVGLAVSAIAQWADCLRQDRSSPHGLRVHRLIEH